MWENSELIKELCETFLTNYGIESQTIMFFRECFELYNELTNHIQNRKTDINKIIHEIIDVSVMLEQLKFEYGITDKMINEKFLQLYKERIG